MFDRATMELNVEPLILGALREDITSEDVSTNCIMRDQCPGNVELICKQDGVICGLQVLSGCSPCWIRRRRLSLT